MTLSTCTTHKGLFVVSFKQKVSEITFSPIQRGIISHSVQDLIDKIDNVEPLERFENIEDMEHIFLQVSSFDCEIFPL